MADMIVWATIAASFAVTFYLLEKQGFSRGAWSPFFCSLLIVPAWFEKLVPGLGGLGIDPRTACCLAIALVLFLQPIEPGRVQRWLFVDTCLILVVLSQLASQLANNDLRPMTMPDLMRTVGLPYFIGRVLFCSPYDGLVAARALALPLVLCSVYALGEALSHQNPVFDLFGSYTAGLDRSILYRWGLKRAMALLSHPIYLSLLLSMMLPFALELLYRSRQGLEARGAWIPAAACGVGIVSTVSRSGQIAMAAVLLADAIFRFPRLRVPLLSVTVAGAMVFLAGREELVALLEQSSGDAEATETIIIKGEPVQYNGTRHRDLLHLVYSDEVKQAGVLGLGYHFLENLPTDRKVPQQFMSIDDHYLITQLRYGTAGVWAFLLFSAAGGYALLRVALDAYHPARTLAGGALGAFLAVVVLARGVSLEGDVAFPWYFLAGMGGRLYSMRLDALDAARRAAFAPQGPGG